MAEINLSLTKTPMHHQDPIVRAKNFEEVALGYSKEQAIEEAKRCLNCKNKPCVGGCPVKIYICWSSRWNTFSYTWSDFSKSPRSLYDLYSVNRMLVVS